MKRKKGCIIGAVYGCLLLTACSTSNPKQKVENEDQILETMSQNIEDESEDYDEISEVESLQVNEEPTEVKGDSIVNETTDNEEVPEATAEISDVIPTKYSTYRTDHAGTIELVTYTTYDYFEDGEEYTKSAYVYLPYGYDESKQYNVLYLMHGIGGSELEWGMTSNTSKVKAMMDQLSYYGDIEPFIVVTPNGRSSKVGTDYNSFYVFGKELRNDLIPFIETKYSTYYDENDMAASRDHRAMAGLSMGGMQTINIGMCECLDIISWFGAFSAAPTSYTADQIVDYIETNFPEDDINYFYNLCGTEDSIAYASSSAAAKNITTLTDRLVDGENFMWQERTGAHTFDIWYLGFYNFAQIAFQS